MTYNEKNILDLVSYFADEADILERKASKAGLFDNAADIGSQREDILRDFLKNHLPRRCDLVKGGYIFNEVGKRSDQIDLIVTNDSTIRFKQTEGEYGKEFNSLEGTVAAISIKSNLDKRGFIDALDNLACIPTTPRTFAPINRQPDAFLGGVLEEMLYKTPYKIIFAFKGMDDEKVVDYLEDYIRDKRPNDEVMADLIIVNKSYFIYKVPIDGHKDDNGNVIVARGGYRAVARSKHIGGLSLMHLVSQIQEVSNLILLAMLSFFFYESSIQEVLKQRDEAPLVRNIIRDEIIGTDKLGTPKPNEKNNNDQTDT